MEAAHQQPGGPGYRPAPLSDASADSPLNSPCSGSGVEVSGSGIMPRKGDGPKNDAAASQGNGRGKSGQLQEGGGTRGCWLEDGGRGARGRGEGLVRGIGRGGDGARVSGSVAVISWDPDLGLRCWWWGWPVRGQGESRLGQHLGRLGMQQPGQGVGQAQVGRAVQGRAQEMVSRRKGGRAGRTRVPACQAVRRLTRWFSVVWMAGECTRSQDEDDRLRAAINEYGECNWKAIAKRVATRNHVQCLQRWKKVRERRPASEQPATDQPDSRDGARGVCPPPCGAGAEARPDQGAVGAGRGRAADGTGAEGLQELGPSGCTHARPHVQAVPRALVPPPRPFHQQRCVVVQHHAPPITCRS